MQTSRMVETWKDSKGVSEEKEMNKEEAGVTVDKEKEENSGLLVTEEV